MLALERQVIELQHQAECWDLKVLLRWGLSEFDKSLAIAASFGAEDVVLIDQASRLGSEFRVFTLDTDFLFPDTYALIDRIEKRYGIQVERAHSDLTPAQQAARYGEALWASQPDQCCQLRKVEPLKKKLSGLRAWVTIADWNWKQVWEYIRANNVPYNPLHDQNYPSIGCTHCTRPVRPDEDPRAGRWSGFNKIECGLHVKDPLSST